MWFSEYLFLERSWAKDENTLKVCLKIRFVLIPVLYVHIFFLCVCYRVFLFNFLLLKSSDFAENLLQLGFQRLSDFPQPLWLALFVEGTRFTQAKLLAAQEYATSTGLAVPRNVLIPRTKVSGYAYYYNEKIIAAAAI